MNSSLFLIPLKDKCLKKNSDNVSCGYILCETEIYDKNGTKMGIRNILLTGHYITHEVTYYFKVYSY